MHILFLLAVLQTVPVQKFPPVGHPGLPGLAEHVRAVCPSNGATTRDALLKRELELADAAYRGRGSADDWAALACARAMLAVNGALAHEGPVMISGTSWLQGGQHAALEALRIQPANVRAASMLAVLTVADRTPDKLSEAAKALLGAVRAGVHTPAALRGCSELAVRIHDGATARDCAESGLVGGSDSTWHLLRLARITFRGGDSAKASQLFEQAAAAAHDSVARAEVAWHLQWFMSPEEQQQYSTIPDATRAIWLRDRMAERDVRDGQPLGARLAEHYSRLDSVEKNFRLFPSSVMDDKLRTAPAVREDGRTPGDPDLAVLSQLEPGAVSARMFREYIRWQVDFDDRGMVWMRFGRPDLRIIWPCDSLYFDVNGSLASGPCGIVREAWRYEIDGRQLLLNFENEAFDGSAQAARLVSGVLGSYLCNIDTIRCGLTELSKADYAARHGKYASAPSSSMLKPEELEHIRQQDREYISVATTKDDNSPRGDKNVTVTSRLHRLWDPLSGESIALLTYALPEKDLSIQDNAGKRTTLVDLELRQWDPPADRWHDTTFTRRFELPDTSMKRPNLVGFIVVPSSPSVSSWSLVATQPDHRRGRAYDLDTPGIRDGSVILSDLVLGAEAQGLTWNLHNVAIPLAPVNAVDRKLPVALYYQVKSAESHTDLRTTVSLYRLEGGVARDSEPALQVSFDQALQAGINEVAPTLDVSRLDKGSYRLEVRLTDARGAVITRRSVALDLE